ncbi:RIP metalloprotease RseP [Pseudomonas alcaligenes]|uniref:Zinc metalloprotease n=1 Tax=Aquipseudomonas alcaligenes TaxID=43263 RepID=A0ABR7RY27_AQUAC|nr:RIP metalloprotease RseP [Pseudomonas alcaligenes]MBC9249709.1 RIP metalloprotease RseP [Pseudomonas alcaligenes]
MSAIYMFFGTLIALGVLVTFHEFGHFWVARRCGVKVLRFSVGFGAPLLRWHDRQGTEFVVAAIPLGGYVKMLDEREAAVPAEQLGQAFNRKSVAQRIAIVAAGPVANFFLAILFFWVIAMLGSQQVRPVIGAVAPESLAAAAGLQAGQEIVAVDGEPTSGWAAISLQLVRRLGESGTLSVQVREPGSTLETSHQLILRDWLRGEEEPDPLVGLGIQRWLPQGAPVVADIVADSVAAQAGLQKEDRLLELDGQVLTGPEQVVQLAKSLAGQSVVLAYERAGERREVRLEIPSAPEVVGKKGYLGAVVGSAPWPAEMLHEVHFGPLEAVTESLARTWKMTVLTLDSLKKMLFGELSVKNLSGPITIAKVAGASAQSGVGDFLNFLAYLSISLGVLNLLPIPVLDGGHLLFYLVEWVRGRPLSERVQGWGIQIGISLVLGVMLLALVNDLSRL